MPACENPVPKGFATPPVHGSMKSPAPNHPLCRLTRLPTLESTGLMQLLQKALVMLMGLALLGLPALAQLPDRVQIRTSGYTLDPATNTLRYQDAIVTYGDITIEGEVLTYSPDQRLITAEGLVRITEGDTIIAGERLTFDLTGRTAIIERASLLDLRQGTRLTADRLKRVSGTHFRAENCIFTTCDPKSPFWKVESSTVNYYPENFATSSHTVLRIRGVPVFYSPFVAWPTVRKRKSGILPPKLSFDHSSTRRYNLGLRFTLPYFWAIDPEHDLTVTPELVENRGSGLKLDYHYAYTQGMQGSVTVQRYFEKLLRNADEESGSRDASSVEDSELRPQRFKVAATHSQQLDPHSRLSLSGLVYSDSQFQREYEEVRSSSDKISQRFSLSANRQFPSGSVTFSTMHERVFKEVALLNRELNTAWVQEQPALRYQFGAKLGSLGLTEWESSVSGALIHYERISGFDGNTILFDPNVRTHFPVFEWFKGSVGVGKRLSAYEVRDPEVAGSAGRYSFNVTTADIELRTSLARTFIRDSGIFSRLKHTITPRLKYEYIEDKEQTFQNAAPPFGGNLAARRLATFRLENVLLVKPRIYVRNVRLSSRAMTRLRRTSLDAETLRRLERLRGRSFPSESDFLEALRTVLGEASNPEVERLVLAQIERGPEPRGSGVYTHGEREGTARRLGNLNLIQRYDFLKADPGFQSAGPAPLGDETQPGSPLLPLRLELAVSPRPGLALGFYNRYHHQHKRIVEYGVSAKVGEGTHNRASVNFRDTAFQYVTPYGVTYKKEKTFGFSQTVELRDDLVFGYSGKFDLDPQSTSRKRRLVSDTVSLDYSPDCWRLALRLQEDVETVTIGSRTEEYVNRSFLVSISLGNVSLPESTLLQQNRGRSRFPLFGYEEQ